MSAAAPASGSGVAWWDGNGLAFGIVVGAEKSRIRVVTVRGREERIRPARIAVAIGPALAIEAGTPEGRRAAGERAAGLAERVTRRAATVDVALLWEVVLDDGLEQAEAGALAGLALDPAGADAAADADGVAEAAILQALAADGLRFVRRADAWVPRSRDQVEALEVERERVAERERERDAVAAALARVAREGVWEPTGSETERRVLDALEQLALFDLATPDAMRAVALPALEAAGVGGGVPHATAFRVLRGVGRFDRDDANLPLLRYRFPVEFPPEALEHAEVVAARGLDATGREDLRGLTAVSIDGASTREIDDLVSVEPGEHGGWRLGIHIADPAAFVAVGDPVDEAARRRALTHYHPDVSLRMLPPRIAEDAASLNAGVDRPALSFLVDVAEDGAVVDARIVRALVRSAARLDYVATDGTLAAGAGDHAEFLRALHEVALVRERRREADGAVVIRTPDVGIAVGPDGEPSLERLDAESPSRRIVTEAMVLAGWLAARHCVERRLPAVYRAQAAPVERVPVPPGGAADPVSARRVRLTLRRAESSLTPAPHGALGLDAYAQATSPLRRYQDLVVHRQLVADLAGEPAPYDEAALREILRVTDAVEADARAAERASNAYWMLRWFEARVGTTVDGVVVATEPRPVVHLLETAWEQPAPSLAGLEAGTAVRMRVVRSDPRGGRLVLRHER